MEPFHLLPGTYLYDTIQILKSYCHFALSKINAWFKRSQRTPGKTIDYYARPKECQQTLQNLYDYISADFYILFIFIKMPRGFLFIYKKHFTSSCNMFEFLQFDFQNSCIFSSAVKYSVNYHNTHARISALTMKPYCMSLFCNTTLCLL